MNEPKATEPAPEPLAQRTVRDLLSERAILRERLASDYRASGFRPSPGQTKRRAEMLQRERAVIAELQDRQAQWHAATDATAATSPEGHLPTADEADRIDQLTPVPQDDEDAYPRDLP